MNIVVTLILPLAVAASSSAFLDEDAPIISTQETRYSFKIDVPKDATPDHSTGIQNFVISCFASSFNDIHDANEYGIEAVNIESDVILPIPATQVSSWNYNMWLYGYYSFVTSYHCNLCPPFMLHSSHHYPEWEDGFCACLQGSGLADIETASDCRIEVQNDKSQLEIQDQGFQSEVEVTFVVTTGDLTDEENTFTMEVLKVSYNVLVDVFHSNIHDVSLQKKKASKIGGGNKVGTKVSNIRHNDLKWIVQFSGIITYGEHHEFPIALSSDSISITHSTWETLYCTMLAEGPHASFAEVSECKITIKSPPSVSVGNH
mmetsp:Transcript_22999/g.33947  ORF Transcript_22999/g.33947 Transcript_22999/m.33947 type:complete len:317 (+) Transcript_22999:420-1370(+)|eukprot:CAMPEP_0194214400 /NCGR_PEP_ID=MMETSP0156-20130528/15556_1 /TAXON_ID=33649 /ORGANISM="Thalassionema nitzschioides, Strain L26-B" /LENGTH=316 /DNA_ID=CAMNT_0038942643 /DNA_START=399 /DNA_END=1349 /DNA_ORIENTATION=-